MSLPPTPDGKPAPPKCTTCGGTGEVQSKGHKVACARCGGSGRLVIRTK